MEEKKELINEENYQKGKNFIKKIRTALLCVGGLLAVAGLVLMIVGFTTNFILGVVGLACLGFGAMAMFAGAATLMFSHRREIVAFGASSMLPVVDEVIDKGAPIADKASKVVGKGLGNVVGGVKAGWTGESSTVECTECHTENSKKNKFCKNCGKPLSKDMYCGKCGKKIDSDTKFCPHCGEKVE